MQHPSTASNAAKFRDELKRLRQAGVKVQHYSADDTVSDTNSVYDLFGCEPISAKKLEVLYPYYNGAKYGSKVIGWQKLLSSGAKEDVCQAEINAVLVNVAADTSASSCGMFKPAREMCLNDDTVVEAAVYTPTAKIDSTGVDSPQAFEIKTSPQTRKAAAGDAGVQGAAGPSCAGPAVDSDIDLLEQVLVRMSVEIYCNALISNFTVLAATGRYAWVVIFERKLEFFNAPEEDGVFETVIIRRILHNDLLKIFFSNVERAAQEPGWYLTTDAAHLVNTIGRLSNPGLCSTRLFDKSESNVYSVCLPRTYKAKNRRIIGPATSHVDLMIKVVHSQRSFDIESSALVEIATAYNNMEPRRTEDRHYALGTCSLCTVAHMTVAEEAVLVSAMGGAQIANDCDGDEVNDEAHQGNTGQQGAPTAPTVTVELAPDLPAEGPVAAPATPFELRLSISALTSTFWTEFDSIDASFADFSQRPLHRFPHPCVWRDIGKLERMLLSEPLTGGTVVMRVGVPLSKVVQKVRVSEWREGVCKCLLAGNMVKWSQGDTRLRNTLLFGHHIQLIDYNHAVNLNAVAADGNTPCGQRRFVEGSLFRSLGSRLASVVMTLETNVDWISADDYEMAMRSMEELARSNLVAE